MPDTRHPDDPTPGWLLRGAGRFLAGACLVDLAYALAGPDPHAAGNAIALALLALALHSHGQHVRARAAGHAERYVQQRPHPDHGSST